MWMTRSVNRVVEEEYVEVPEEEHRSDVVGKPYVVDDVDDECCAVFTPQSKDDPFRIKCDIITPNTSEESPSTASISFANLELIEKHWRSNSRYSYAQLLQSVSSNFNR